MNTQTVEDLSLNQVYSLDTGTTVDATKGIIVKLAPYQCKIYICGEAKKK